LIHALDERILARKIAKQQRMRDVQPLGELACITGEPDLGEEFDRFVDDVALALGTRQPGRTRWRFVLARFSRLGATRRRASARVAFHRHFVCSRAPHATHLELTKRSLVHCIAQQTQPACTTKPSRLPSRPLRLTS
jgi:hypothetical protein